MTMIKAFSSEKIKLLVTAAFFVALDVIVTRFLGFEAPTPLGPIKVDFQTVVAVLCGFALGPLWGCITLVASDLLGIILNSGTLGMFFGFTLSAFCRGFFYGLLLYKKEPKPLRIILSIVVVFLSVDLTLNTVWLSIMMGTPFFPLWVSRIIPKCIIMIVQALPLLLLPTLFKIIKPKKAV